jgi:hypothetical protein
MFTIQWCVSGQYYTTLVFCTIYLVLPEDDPFRVEKCTSTKEDLSFSGLPVALTSARAGVYYYVFPLHTCTNMNHNKL